MYAVFWAALAIDPHDRGDWALENVLVVVAAVLLFFSYKRVLLSRTSYTLIFIFLGLQKISAPAPFKGTLKETCRCYP